MFELTNKGVIRVSQGDTFTLNVISSIPFKEGDIATLTVKDDLDDTKVILEKVVTEFNKVRYKDKNCCCNSDKDWKFAGMARFKFDSLDTCKEAGTYYYDVQLDYKEHGIRYTAMWPTKFIIVEDVTNNVFDMTELVPPTMMSPSGGETEDEE